MSAATVSLHLRWGDQDPYQHVNNVAIAGLLEQARALVFWGEGSLLPRLTVASDRHVVVAEAHIVYLKPIDYRPEPLVAFAHPVLDKRFKQDPATSTVTFSM